MVVKVNRVYGDFLVGQFVSCGVNDHFGFGGVAGALPAYFFKDLASKTSKSALSVV